MSTHSLEEVGKAFDAAPEAIRTYLEEGKLAIIATELAQRYKLSGEPRKSFIIASRDTLLGLGNPSSYSTTLRAAGIPDGTVGPIADEIRARVFEPLNVAPAFGSNSSQASTPIPAVGEASVSLVQQLPAEEVSSLADSVLVASPIATASLVPEIKTPAPAPNPVSYSSDPYREPIT